jgi:hypothetical protein
MHLAILDADILKESLRPTYHSYGRMFEALFERQQPRFAICSLGCKLNQSDEDDVRRGLRQAGLRSERHLMIYLTIRLVAPAIAGLAVLMYTSGLVPRPLAMLGLIAGPVLLVLNLGVLFGLWEQTSAAAILVAPEFAWELLLGIYAAARGFRRDSPILSAAIQNHEARGKVVARRIVDALWERLHAHFSEPELVELGCAIALTFGQQSWIRLLGIDHHQVLAGTAASMAPGFEDASALAQAKASGEYWAAGNTR